MIFPQGIPSMTILSGWTSILSPSDTQVTPWPSSRPMKFPIYASFYTPSICGQSALSDLEIFFCFWTLTGFSSPYLAWWNHIKSLFLRVESGWIPIFPWLNPCRLWKIAIKSSDSGTKPTDHSHISCYLHCHSIVPSGIFAPGFH